MHLPLLLDATPPTPVSVATFTAYFTGIDGIVTAISTLSIAILTAVIAYYAYGAYLAGKETLAESKKANAKSEKANLDNVDFNHKQAFENTVFKMLDFHNTKYREMFFLYPKDDKRVFGGEAFHSMYSSLRTNYNKSKAENSKASDLDLIVGSFQFLYENHSQIGAYYKNLYLLIKFIDEAQGISEKGLYISIIKAQLSRFEILLLPYDCVWIEGDKEVKKEFTTLVGKYKLLTALERDGLIERKSHEHIFQSKQLIE